jgi:anti-sigma factor RsiW
MMKLVPPTDCTRAREAVSARLDGELAELDGVRLDAHLRRCEACATFAREAAAGAALLRGAALETPDFAFVPSRIARRRLGRPAAALPSFFLGRLLGGQGGSAPQVAASGPIVAQTIPSVVPGLDPGLLAMLHHQAEPGRIIPV